MEAAPAAGALQGRETPASPGPPEPPAPPGTRRATQGAVLESGSRGCQQSQGREAVRRVPRGRATLSPITLPPRQEGAGAQG